MVVHEEPKDASTARPTEGVRYYAEERTVALWWRDDPAKRKVFNHRTSSGRPSPLFMVVRYLVATNNHALLAQFLDEAWEQKALLAECERYCTQEGIQDWRDLDEHIIDLLDRLTLYGSLAKRTRRAGLDPRSSTIGSRLVED